MTCREVGGGRFTSRLFVICNELPCYTETSNSVANVISYTDIAAGIFGYGYEF